MTTTERLSLEKIDAGFQKFGNHFPDAYSANLQKIDDNVQIKLLAAAGKIPVYDEDGLLISSGVAPEDLESGLIESILTTQGMLLYRAASALAALSPDTAGKSLLTQGPGGNPIFGYPSHATLTNLTLGDPHTQYLNTTRGDARYPLLSLLTTEGDMLYRDGSGWQRLAKGSAGQSLIQGASGPVWTTREFNIGFPFGNGANVIEAGRLEFEIPINCKIVAARIREASDVSGSITCTLYKRTYAGTWGSALDTFTMSSATKFEETGLAIALTKGDFLSVRTSSISSVKQIICSFSCEAT